MRNTILFLLLLSTSAAIAQAPAKVTIYTQPGYMRGAGKNTATLGTATHEAPAVGSIFVDDEKQVFLGVGRFITLQMAPGNHLISTKETKKNPKPSESMTLVVEPGKQYFVRYSSTARGFYIVQKETGHLTAVDCRVAQDEAEKTKPIAARFIEKRARAALVDSVYFPRCEQ